MHRFQLSTTLCYGPDALAELSELSGRRVFIVTDGFMVNTALMARVRDQLELQLQPLGLARAPGLGEARRAMGG